MSRNRVIRLAAACLAAGALVTLGAAPSSGAQSATSDSDRTNAAVPDQKRDAPATDLTNYPKIPADPTRKPAVPAPAGVDTSEVISKSPLPGGGFTLTIYDLPVGVPAQQGAERIRAGGDKNVEVVTDDALHSIMAPDDCALGIARTNGCPPAFWSNNGYDDPQVRFNDHSGANWPVTTMVPRWNQTVGIDSYYLWNSCPFQAGARCVDVYSGNYGAIGWQGQTTLTFPYGNHRIGESGAFVQLNDYRNAAQGYSSPFPNITCHELGHALGLAHNAGSTGCMETFSTGGSTPINDERNMLTSVYSIYRNP